MSRLRYGICADWSSRYTATFGKMASVPLPWVPSAPELRPRMKIRSWPGPQLAVLTFGTYVTQSTHTRHPPPPPPTHPPEGEGAHPHRMEAPPPRRFPRAPLRSHDHF